MMAIGLYDQNTSFIANGYMPRPGSFSALERAIGRGVR